jgi:GTP pyrophosphokinase
MRVESRIKPDTPVEPSKALQEWLASISNGRRSAELDVIRRAGVLAEQAHAGQTRISGEPYVAHSLAVARTLADLRLDVETIVAAILHDVVEDTEVTLEDIEEQFGPGVRLLVDGVTKMHAISGNQEPQGKNKKDRIESESLRKMLLAMVEDVRVVLIKLADRLHNMRTLSVLSKTRQQAIARETLDILAPLANRLGIWQVKWELEDLSFRYLHPEQYKQIANWLAERRVDREHYITDFVNTLQLELAKVGIHAEVTGRPKHIYSIWRKMKRKQVDFNQIFDVRAVRVLVDQVKDCYSALGVVHTCWPYIAGEFDDYIATPKENNYQSIHTAIIGPGGKTVEVQIRTHDMHQQSELGIAAHWRYKEGARHDSGFDQKIAWLRQLLEWKDEVADASEFVDQFKSAVFEDRVYVFTPKGNVLDLQAGATPLDFAYHVHTEVGHHCRGAKVNGHIVPLTYKLKTGEQVEILSVKKGGPSRDWLNPDLGYLATSRARAKVQSWFRQANFEENVSAGRAQLDRELKRVGLGDTSFEKLAQRLKFTKVDDMLASIGRGEIKTSQIVNASQDLTEPPRTEQEPQITTRPPSSEQRTSAIQIQGVGNLLTHMAGCCKPVPGDAIVGFITHGRGVTIHRSDCPNVLRYSEDGQKERLIEVEWGRKAASTYPVDVRITAYDRHGLLRDITAILANDKINVIGVNTISDKVQHMAQMTLTLEISNLDMLSKVLGKIDQLPNVTDVHRKIH